MLTSTNLALAGFVLASFSALLWPQLPPVSMLPAMLLLALLFLYLGLNTFVSGSLLGIIWMASVGHCYLHWQLPKDKIHQVVTVMGKITTVMHASKDLRFQLQVQQLDGETLWLRPTVRLSWRSPAWPLKAAQRVQLQVKLKPPHGLANQGAFNYQQWLFSRNIVATGYVRQQGDNQLLAKGYSLRQQQLDALLALPLAHKEWLAALSLGYRGLLQQPQWQVLQHTGTAHLIAISGLHLGLVVSLSYFVTVLLLTSLLRLGVCACQYNLHHLALLLTLLWATAYAALSGFALPVTRALFMLVLATLVLLFKRYWRPLQLLLYCLGALLLLLPHSIFSLSFWLSFTAILVIWFIFWRWPPVGSGLQLKAAAMMMLKVQLGLTLLMLPLVGWQFQLLSVAAPVVNLIAVPVVSFILVPLCLLATALLLVGADWALPVFMLADHIMAVAIEGLTAVSASKWTAQPLLLVPLLPWLFFALAMLLLLLPPVPGKNWVSLLLILPLLSYSLRGKQPGWQLHILDVGQGLAVLISKDQRAILYDVGARYPSGFNMADAAILPFLRGQGIAQLDLLFISHGDNDHSGSLAPLQQGIEVKQLLTNESGCNDNFVLNWQGLDLNGLWPQQDSQGSNNQRSCVLRISDGVNTVLLPGDIDTAIERQLLKNYPVQLPASVLVAPHHGSNTSSSAAFIAAVAPQLVVFSQGYRNRWGFPRPEVVARYKQAQVPTLSTSKAGQISVFFTDKADQADKGIAIKTYRRDFYPFWYLRSVDSE